MPLPRVLVLSEAVTLAHLGRSFSLAQRLRRSHQFEIGFASATVWNQLLGPHDLWSRTIHSISPSTFMHRLDQGEPVYSADELEAYVREDEALIAEFRPDVVIGDFRISLAASARRCKVPYVAMTNAYWSPAAEPKFIVPDIPATRLLGVKMAQTIIPLMVPSIFAVHSLKMNQFKKRLGLPWWELDLRKVYGDADYLWYTDLPNFVPIRSLPKNHDFIGWVPWSPEIPLPSWWNTLPQDRPVVYVSLGSSGPARLLPEILESLGALPVTVIASGQPTGTAKNGRLFTSEMIPGDAVLDRCALVICNGGSPSVQQALAHGIPALGIPRNLDQYLSMHYTEKAGAGLMIRSDQVTPALVVKTVTKLLEAPEYRAAARKLQTDSRELSAVQSVESLLSKIVS
ncbi:MAG TPA: nucleotide disphospho-sugar-binding domain-containing protein [Bdellovibrionota bacterium]|nr:nucleotide disphospho-sugar-binding domain-containing protein [Bdellovibrionota bacterium]